MKTEFAFVTSLKACTSKKDLLTGRRLHVDILQGGLVSSPYLASSLISMYAKCGVLLEAQQVHDEFYARNVVSWNALLAGYARHGRGHEALNCFDRMLSESITPNAVTFICVLKACGNARAIGKGKQIHGDILNGNMLKKDVMLGTALVDMYAKCGVLSKAHRVLKELNARNEVSWSALIAGYMQQGQACEALDCVEQMQSEGLSADAVTFTFILKACQTTGAIEKGKQIHNEIASRGLLEKDLILATALVNMYAQCGLLTKAHEVFEELPHRDIVSWNALIAGYAQHGRSQDALNCLKSMQSEGINPDAVTFLGILTAYSHSGLVEEAQMHFGNMWTTQGILLNSDHHTCMVAIYGCVGQFDDAISMIKSMSSLDHPPVWLALLDACRKWGYVKLGVLAFIQAIQVDNSSAPYALMANIYTAAGMTKDAEKLEVMRLETVDCELTNNFL